MRALTALCLAPLALAACTQQAEQGSLGEGEAGSAVPAIEEQAGSGDPAELPPEFVKTAWRATAPDGARYTTYLDEGGLYRDLRNGDPWQEGSWEIDSEGRICFLPESEGAVLRCWHPDRMQGPSSMIVTSDSDVRVRLQRADYSPPEGDEPSSDDAAE